MDAGSFVYPTHVYNISRIPNGAVANHFGADNFLQAEAPQHFIGGKPQLVFGGRSIFWSGLIPRPQDWELEFFPTTVRAALDDDYLRIAGERMNASSTLGRKARELVDYFRNSPIANDFVIHETPRALHQPYLLADGTPAEKFFVEPTGVFNTAELLINQTGLTRHDLDLDGPGLFVKLQQFRRGRRRRAPRLVRSEDDGHGDGRAAELLFAQGGHRGRLDREPEADQPVLRVPHVAGRHQATAWASA